MMIQRMAVILLVFISTLTPAVASEQKATFLSDSCDETDGYQSIDIFDPELDPALKAKLLKDVEALAKDGCLYDQYVWGTLLRFGKDLPGNLLDKDVQKAAPLIEAYAKNGYLIAYSDLAEMALASDDARNAMLWTQVYLYFVTRHADKPLTHFDRRGYNADLLSRAMVAWRNAKFKKSQIEPMLDEYLARHETAILKGLQDSRSNLPTSHPTSSQNKPGSDVEEAPALQVKARPKVINTHLVMSPSYAVFLLEVQPSGAVSRVVAESFAPSPEAARKLRPMIMGITFEPFKWHEPQVVSVPVMYGYADGPSLKKVKTK